MFTLSRVQFFLFLFIIQTGTVFISFQSRFIMASDHNAWVIFIFAGSLHYVQLLLFEKFHKRFNPGKAVSHLYIAYWIIITISFLSYINYTLSVWIFPHTPQFITMATIVGVSLYANTRRPETIINLPIVIIPLIPIFIVFLFMSLPDLVWTRLFPLDVMEYKPLLKGLFLSQATFIGIEIFLFLRQYVKDDEQVKGKPIFIYQSIWFLFFFTTVIFVLLYFPISGLKFVTEPLLQLLKYQKVTFVERLDMFFLYIWVIWSAITVILYNFMIIHTRKIHFKNTSNRFIILLHLILVVASVYLATKDRVEIVRRAIIYIHIVFSILVPIIVILMDRREKK
ncbi:hypothetical protein SLU01_09540 [Sporosarcina luteola]|uniref:Spore germination protein n=1 Tax=Sporosarcina luteola TaxID=582850 RepID=A0A511Z5H0_9BACL|nr:GerAB/ArcD/ProY family transporter [Sporosarcina luteola]GEN82642.1 hypothetical protein SLU01_09540 [Sporosarcina luteola]